jgi:predicted regulator of Ras-like GTPase activity (Roadblock/LC7/MglB family)
MASKIEKMIGLLKDLGTTTSDIEASAIVSNDGFIIASVLPQSIDEERIGAMSAAMLSLGERAVKELSKGVLEQTYIKGKDGYVIMTSVGDSAVLTTLTTEKAKLGLIFLEMRKTAEELLKLL